MMFHRKYGIFLYKFYEMFETLTSKRAQKQKQVTECTFFDKNLKGYLN